MVNLKRTPPFVRLTLKIMGNAKGAVLKHFKEYVIALHGEDGWLKLVGFLSDEERMTLTLNPDEQKWYPMLLLKRLIGAFDSLYGNNGQFASIVPIAEHIAENDIIPFLERFTNLQSPSAVVRNTPSLWKRYFDSGEIKIDDVDDAGKHYSFFLENFESVSGMIFCTELVSTWLRRILAHSGAEEIDITHSDFAEANGSPATLDVSWS